MTVVRGFAITLTSGLVFGGVGAGLGYLLGTVAPDYYRTVFRLAPEVAFNASQLGLGLGVTQGTATGLIVGLVIVVSVAWYRSQTASSLASGGEERTD
ncbi:hypothetical protein [Rosistilla oblonga]|uniref:hypothetical protein n=1 Tax=Rosistilla oblonga TaxID=2527990 RepID=UPI003A973B6F